MSVNAYKLLPVVVGTLLIGGLLILLLRRRKGATAIKAALRGTAYESYAPWAVAQAQHESANFQSQVYRTCNNPFGMKVPSRRPYVGIGACRVAPDGGSYSRYASDFQAAKDFLEWLKFTKFPGGLSSVEQYVTALRERSYFTDSEYNYLNGMKRFL